MKRIFWVIFIWLFTSDIALAQCAMCKAVVEGSNEEMAKGINSGILYLMVFPYLLVGTILYFAIQYQRKK